MGQELLRLLYVRVLRCSGSGVITFPECTRAEMQWVRRVYAPVCTRAEM